MTARLKDPVITGESRRIGYKYLLTDDDVREIKRLYASTIDLCHSGAHTDPERWTQSKLADKFGVSRGAISKIIQRTAYRWVE